MAGWELLNFEQPFRARVTRISDKRRLWNGRVVRLRPLLTLNLVENERPMPAKLLKGLFVVSTQPLGFRHVVPVFGQSLDQSDLLTQSLLALGDIHFCLGEVLAFFGSTGHGAADHAPVRARGPWKFR